MNCREESPFATPAPWRLTISGDESCLAVVEELLREQVGFTQLDPECCDEFCRAVLELVRNAIEWGNLRRSDKAVTLRLAVTDEHVSMTIEDQGDGFDPLRLDHAAHDGDPEGHMSVRERLGLRPGGYGIMVARGLSDGVEYNEKGNICTVTKRFARAETPSEESGLLFSDHSGQIFRLHVDDARLFTERYG